MRGPLCGPRIFLCQGAVDVSAGAYYTVLVKGPQGLFIYQKQTAMTSPFTYLKHVREEFTHIVWPTNRTAIAHTLVVVLIAAAIALLVGVLDYVFNLGVSRSIIGG